MNELCYLSAREARRLFIACELSPVELLGALIERAELTEPAVNSLCHVDFDRAFDVAREAERRFLGKGGPIRPLEGIPVAVKEDTPIQGQPWTQGSMLMSDVTADYTSTMVQRILDAGGLVHARTTSAEFGAAPFTRSLLWGVTRNPWNPAFAAGGSSGGSGAALASGVTTLATGTDIAGSIRIPASFTGIAGYKPPHGRVPVDPPLNLDPFMHYGPMARTVEDIVMLQNVIAGPSPTDIMSLRPKLVLPEAPRGVDGLRIAISEDLGSYDVDPEIRRNTRAVANVLRSAGATVEPVDLLIERETVNRALALHVLAAEESLSEVPAGGPESDELLSPYLAVGMERKIQAAAGGNLTDLRELKVELYRPVARVFDHYDALIHPTVVTRGFDADSDYLGDTDLVIDGHTFTDPDMGLMTIIWNILSQVPCLSVPSGIADNGVPTGVQIVGPTFDDEVVFRIGAAIQRELMLFTPQLSPRLA